MHFKKRNLKIGQERLLKKKQAGGEAQLVLLASERDFETEPMSYKYHIDKRE